LPEKDDSLQQTWPLEKQKEYITRWHELIVAAPKATLAQYVDAIDYVVKRIGIDHVGIASDFNHGGGVTGWDNEGEAQNVTAELLRHGYSESQIAKLWGGNFLPCGAKRKVPAASSPLALIILTASRCVMPKLGLSLGRTHPAPCARSRSTIEGPGEIIGENPFGLVACAGAIHLTAKHHYLPARKISITVSASPAQLL
jgi:hypothetical protein